jgi:hypothetical protein
LCKNPICYFHSASRFATQTLAHVLDSLVRVSRRVEKNHLASVIECQYYHSAPFGRQQYKYSSQLSRGLCSIERHPQSYFGVNVSTGTTVSAGFRRCTVHFQKRPKHAGKKHEKHHRGQVSGPQEAEVFIRTSTISYNNLTLKNWFHSLPT